MWSKIIQVSLVSCLVFIRVNPQISQQCPCIPRNTCYQNLTSSTDGSGIIDIRIVSPGDSGIPTVPPTAPTTASPIVCPAGTEQCCTQPGLTGCGLRYNIPFSPVPPLATGQMRYGSQPWQAIIYDLTGSTPLGGGALVDQFNIITAAHKVSGRLPGSIKVRLGEWDLAKSVEPYPPQEAIVAQIKIHPLYNLTIPLTSNNLSYDVAILRLASPITQTNPAINSICLPSSLSVFDGQRCLVAGWGKDAFNGSFQIIAKEVEVPMVPYAECQAKLRATVRLGPLFNLDPNSFICAGGEPGKDACTGDGGSALACIVGGRYQLAGLVAWGIGCADSNVPGVYVKMSSFTNWVQSQQNT